MSKAAIIFENVCPAQYQQAAEVYAAIGGYQIFNHSVFEQLAAKSNVNVESDSEQSDMRSQNSSQYSAVSSTTNGGAGLSIIDGRKKIMFEMTSMLNSLNQVTKNKAKQNGESEIVKIIKQSLLDQQQNEEDQDYLALYLSLRIIIAYALGMNPIFLLPGPSNAKGRYGLGSPLITNMPYDTQAGGRCLINRLPLSVSVPEDYQTYVYQTYGNKDEADLQRI